MGLGPFGSPHLAHDVLVFYFILFYTFLLIYFIYLSHKLFFEIISFILFDSFFPLSLIYFFFQRVCEVCV